jgi:hypothetical protein
MVALDLPRRRQLAGVGLERGRSHEKMPDLGSEPALLPKNALQEGRALRSISRPLDCGRRQANAAGRACGAGDEPSHAESVDLDRCGPSID